MTKEIDTTNGADTQKPQKGQFRKTADRLRRGKENHLSHRASVIWHADAQHVCDVHTRSDVVVPVDEIKALLLKSRTAQSLFEAFEENPLEIVHDNQVPLSQFYARGERRIVAINPYRPKGDLVNLLSRELRRAWHHLQGSLVNPLSFEPDEAILFNRAQQADALMISIKIAWELKLIGEPEAWDYLVGSPTADVTRTFEMKAQSDFRSMNNGEAARAAYDKFFEGNRTKSYDKRIIHQMLLDEVGYMRTTERRPKMSVDALRRLGVMPQGKNYLALSQARSPADLCYATVEDRSNANFLWFIKFERSFQEKELQMVQESVKMSAEIVDFAKWALQSSQSDSLPQA